MPIRLRELMGIVGISNQEEVPVMEIIKMVWFVGAITYGGDLETVVMGPMEHSMCQGIIEDTEYIKDYLTTTDPWFDGKEIIYGGGVCLPRRLVPHNAERRVPLAEDTAFEVPKDMF